MWGAGRIICAVLVIGWGVIFSMTMETQAEIEKLRISADKKCAELQKESVRRDQEIATKFLNVTTRINNDNNDVVKVLNVISINQKRILETLNIPYMEPEWIHKPSRDDY